MKKDNYKWIIAILIIGLIIGGTYFYFSNRTNNKTNNYEADKTSTGMNKDSNNDENNENNEDKEKEKQKQEENKEPEYIEEVISTFSTKIYNNDPARQNNIKITCETLNNTIIKNNETFSFCNTVGQSTSDKGYQKADIFDNKGRKKKGLGGRKLSNKQYFI